MYKNQEYLIEGLGAYNNDKIKGMLILKHALQQNGLWIIKNLEYENDWMPTSTGDSVLDNLISEYSVEDK